MTRPRGRRRGNPRSKSVYSCLPAQDLPTAVAQLQECLPEASWICSVADAEHATADLLRPLFTTLCKENNPKVHFCIANYLHALHPSLEALPLLCNLAEKAASSPHPKDAAALSVSLRAILYLGQNAPRDESTRDAYSRALPTLMPVLQTAIFKPRQSVLASSSTTEDASGKVISFKTSLLSARPHALRVLIFLTEIVSRPMAQYWIQLLPSRPGVPNTNSMRDNLATIVLYDSQTEVRSLSVTAITSLILSSKTFIQNSFIVSKQYTAGFTPSSARILNCCRALFSVLSSCLPRESNGVVVAKLARLTAQLFSVMPIPAMKGLSIQNLLQSLLQRALDQPETDFTARVACASALANALSCSASLLEPSFLSWLSSQIAGSLHPHQPVAELLVAFRSVVHVRPDLFSSGWFIIKAHLQELSQTAEIALHTIRVFSTFLDSCLKAQQPIMQGGKLRQYVPLVVDVYRSLVKGSIKTNNRVLRTSAIAVVQLLFQFHAVVASSTPHDVTSEELDTIAKDAVHTVKHLIMLRDVVVLAACIRAIAHVHLDLEPNFAVDSLRLIYNIMEHAESSGTQATKFCMSTMTRVVENFAKHSSFHFTDEILRILTRGSHFAVEILRNSPDRNVGTAIKSSSDRANEEANRTAAVGLVACHINVGKSLNEESCNSKEFTVHIDLSIQLLRQLLQNEAETLNLRCCTCKALGQMVSVHRSSLWGYEADILCDIVAIMSSETNIRLQICSARSVIQIMKSPTTDDSRLAILQSSIKCFLATKSKMQSGGVMPKSRNQLAVLLNMIGELVLMVFRGASSNLLTEVKNRWDNQWESNILIACVSSHLSLPKYVTCNTECDLEKIMDSTPAAERDVMQIILGLTDSIRRPMEESFTNDEKISCPSPKRG